MRAVSTILLAALLSALTPVASGFALLGPFKNHTNNAPDPWQGKPYAGLPGGLGYELYGDIGGPMFPFEAYRWNIPTIFYGFDQAFVDYFGQPGIDAVESAIATLNAVPPASEMSTGLMEFPFDIKGEDGTAGSLNLLDLKSYTLCLLLEQLGLANPERFVWGLHARDPYPQWGFTNYSAFLMNYDPVTYQPTRFVNGVIYNYEIVDSLGPLGGEWASAVEWYQLDPFYLPYSSVAGGLGSTDFQFGSSPREFYWWSGLLSGQFFRGLTRDDVGGLRFLLRRDNKVWEPLLPGVIGAGTNSSNFVNVALRGGIEKLTFLRLPFDALTGQFLPLTNSFLDAYYTNDLCVTQTLQRVVARPDILFTARDLGVQVEYFNNDPELIATSLLERSGTGGWQNNGALNGREGAGGPGLITPGATITFSTPGKYVLGSDRATPRSVSFLWQWASFDGSKKPIVAHLGPAPAGEIVHLGTRRIDIAEIPNFEWTLLGEAGQAYRVDYSINLIDWFELSRHYNFNGVLVIHHPLFNPQGFFRVVSEPWPF